MRGDDRGLLDRALEPARRSAYAGGEFVGQESFMSATEIRCLASRAGIGPGVSVLDLCCGVAGPGRLVTRELGCAYLGVDASPGAIEVARQRASGGCRFEAARVPPVPAGPFDVVLLLETMLAFPDKGPLLEGISSALPVGGRFAFTVEVGEPLSDRERAQMPAADTVWPMPLAEVRSSLERVGLEVRWWREWTRPHQATAFALREAFATEAGAIRAQLGGRALDRLLAAHGLWSEWLEAARVRKLAFVAEKADTAGSEGPPARRHGRSWPDEQPPRAAVRG